MIDFDTFKKKSGKSRLNEQEKLEFVEHIYATGTQEEKASLAYNWVDIWARDEQVPYYFCDFDSWDEWDYIAGRGSQARQKLVQNLSDIWSSTYSPTFH